MKVCSVITLLVWPTSRRRWNQEQEEQLLVDGGSILICEAVGFGWVQMLLLNLELCDLTGISGFGKWLK